MAENKKAPNIRVRLPPGEEPRYTDIELSERERKLIEFIREFGFGSLTLEVQRGEAVVIRQPVKTVKLFATHSWNCGIMVS